MGIVLRKCKNNSFSVLIEKSTPKRHYIPVEPRDYHTFGLSSDMTYDEALEAKKQFLKKTQLEKKREVNSFLRGTDNRSIHEVYLPLNLIIAFEFELAKKYEDNGDRLDTILQHWRSAQKLIVAIEALPPDFFNKRFEIYNYFKKQTWSPDYMKRITKILNEWGSLYSRKAQSFYQIIPRINGSWKQKVLDAREDKVNVRQPAKPLTWDVLKKYKSTFETDGLELHWNWLFIGLHFGLRPSEIDSLKSPKNWKTEYDTDLKVNVLHVYQSKLQMLKKEDRWKVIPVYSIEQKQALKLIESKVHKRPLPKTIQRIMGEGYDCYSPRKGFTDLMLENHWSLEDVSTFLGHSSIDTTWRHYKNKKRFKMPKAS
jgi:integrase